MSFKVKDHYYKKAKKEKFLARSVYKLEEIDQKYQILKKNDRVIDLGYFPGSWMQYTLQKIGPGGSAIGLDIQPLSTSFENVKNLKLFEQDFLELEDLNALGLDQKIDVLLSDMAPSTTGIKSVDQIRSLNLVEDVFRKLPVFLRPGGHLVVKVFDSHEAQQFIKAQKKIFEKFHHLKPKSTRSVSKEFFIIGKGYLG